MQPEQAMQEYISLVNVLDPDGATKVKTQPLLNMMIIYSFLDLDIPCNN